MFSCKFPEIFKKTCFIEHARTDVWVKWTKKIVFTKSIHRETPVITSFIVQLQTCGLTVFPKRDFITGTFLWKLGRFTEHQFYRTTLRGCFWFPVTFSMYYLPYIILVSVLVLYYFYYYYYYYYYYYCISINIISLVSPWS